MEPNICLSRIVMERNYDAQIEDAFRSGAEAEKRFYVSFQMLRQKGHRHHSSVRSRDSLRGEW